MGRREDNKRRKLEALSTAGLGAFSTDGFDVASIETIAREAGVARGTFYLYFDDKLALFRALVDPWLDEVAAAMGTVTRSLAADADITSLYQGMGMRIAMAGMARPDVVLLSFREMRASHAAGDWLRTREGELVSMAVEMTRAAGAHGLITVADPEVTTRMVIGAIERLTFDLLSGGFSGDPLAVAEQATTLFARALLPPAHD